MVVIVPGPVDGPVPVEVVGVVVAEVLGHPRHLSGASDQLGGLVLVVAEVVVVGVELGVGD